MGEQVAAGLYGGIAQLGEHLPCKQGVKGSNPFISTDRQQLVNRSQDHECQADVKYQRRHCSLKTAH